MLPDDPVSWFNDPGTQAEIMILAGMVIAVALPPLLLIRQIRRQPNDSIGTIKREAHKGMLRAMLLFYAGVLITGVTLGAASGPNGGSYVVAWGPMLFGGFAFLTRSVKYFLRTKPRLDALAFVGAQQAPSLGWNPPKQGRGFWGWVRFGAISLIVLAIGARVLYALSTTTAPQSSRVVGQATVPARADTPPPTSAPSTNPTPHPTMAGAAASTQAPRPTEPAPIAVPTLPARWGFFDEFLGDIPEETADDGAAVWGVENGSFSIEILQPTITHWFTSGPPAEERDTRFRVDVGKSSGDGNVTVLVLDAAENPVWIFNVFPTSRQWSVDRMSDARGETFAWVTPRSYQRSLSEHTIIEVEVRDDIATLYINGQDVMTPARVRLDPVPGLQQFGWGAAGDGFSVEFDSVSLQQASPK